MRSKNRKTGPIYRLTVPALWRLVDALVAQPAGRHNATTAA